MYYGVSRLRGKNLWLGTNDHIIMKMGTRGWNLASKALRQKARGERGWIVIILRFRNSIISFRNLFYSDKTVCGPPRFSKIRAIIMCLHIPGSSMTITLWSPHPSLSYPLPIIHVWECPKTTRRRKGKKRIQGGSFQHLFHRRRNEQEREAGKMFFGILAFSPDDLTTSTAQNVGNGERSKRNWGVNEVERETKTKSSGVEGHWRKMATFFSTGASGAWYFFIPTLNWILSRA